ncbi:hypothetical protein GCM10027447_06760 [Glycomyces halotolerans]
MIVAARRRVGATVSEVTPDDTSRIRDDICAAGHFFASAEAVRRWIEAHPTASSCRLPTAWRWSALSPTTSTGKVSKNLGERCRFGPGPIDLGVKCICHPNGIAPCPIYRT